MPPRSGKQTLCQVCSINLFKYTCSKCYIPYCSVSCYKEHQQVACNSTVSSKVEPKETFSRDEVLAVLAVTKDSSVVSSQDPSEGSPLISQSTTSDSPLVESTPLRPLTSLKWPYVPDESAYPDPLKRDDPKDLQLRQYEAIARSPRIREILNKHQNLPALLTSIDKLRGAERETALQKALGVTPPDIDDWRRPREHSEDVLVLREFAEAVETAIRGGNDAALGLSWGEES